MRTAERMNDFGRRQKLIELEPKVVSLNELQVLVDFLN
jgi:hypothetical protein